MKYLIVVDVQDDFIDGVLGTGMAQAMMPEVPVKVDTRCCAERNGRLPDGSDKVIE